MSIAPSALRESLIGLFADPISLEVMQDPMMNPDCGHTFERSQIEGWIAHRMSNDQPTNCPLCRAPLQGLIPNILVRNALAILNAYRPVLSREELTDEKREDLDGATTHITQRRARDQEEGNASQLAEPLSFPRRVAAAVSRFYGSSR